MPDTPQQSPEELSKSELKNVPSSIESQNIQSLRNEVAEKIAEISTEKPPTPSTLQTQISTRNVVSLHAHSNPDELLKIQDFSILSYPRSLTSLQKNAVIDNSIQIIDDICVNQLRLITQKYKDILSKLDKIKVINGDHCFIYECEPEICGKGGIGRVEKGYFFVDQNNQALELVKKTPLREVSPEFSYEARAHSFIRKEIGNKITNCVIAISASDQEIFMPYISGTKLDDSKKSFIEKWNALVQVMKAVRQLHRHGFVHRDIKPGNIMIDINNIGHLIDFTLAGRVENVIEPLNPEGVELGNKCGTTGYFDGKMHIVFAADGKPTEIDTDTRKKRLCHPQWDILSLTITLLETIQLIHIEKLKVMTKLDDFTAALNFDRLRDIVLFCLGDTTKDISAYQSAPVKFLDATSTFGEKERELVKKFGILCQIHILSEYDDIKNQPEKKQLLKNEYESICQKRVANWFDEFIELCDNAQLPSLIEQSIIIK